MAIAAPAHSPDTSLRDMHKSPMSATALPFAVPGNVEGTALEGERFTASAPPRGSRRVRSLPCRLNTQQTVYRRARVRTGTTIAFLSHGRGIAAGSIYRTGCAHATQGLLAWPAD